MKKNWKQTIFNPGPELVLKAKMLKYENMLVSPLGQSVGMICNFSDNVVELSFFIFFGKGASIPSFALRAGLEHNSISVLKASIAAFR